MAVSLHDATPSPAGDSYTTSEDAAARPWPAACRPVGRADSAAHPVPTRPSAGRDHRAPDRDTPVDAWRDSAQRLSRDPRVRSRDNRDSEFASNEPITLSGSRAQRILQRRINQSIAEYEVINTLELSWGGLCTHVRDGWNIGKPPYGYRAKTYRHPNPAKADRGYTKTRLEPDGVRGETVTQIALWRYHEQVGYDTIAERLNADLRNIRRPSRRTNPGRGGHGGKPV
jgi:hypothetical protein